MPSFILFGMDSQTLSGAPSFGSPASQGVERVLISGRRIRRRVRELGRQLTDEYAGKEVVCVGALNGVVCFLADLVREMDVPTPLELVSVDRTVADGVHTVEIQEKFHEPLKDRHVLIIEDIVDSGVTLTALTKRLRQEQPASLKICTLLDKPANRQVQVFVDYVGFTIPPVFVVGYGLDYEGFYRNLPFVGVISTATWPPTNLLSRSNGNGSLT